MKPIPLMWSAVVMSAAVALGGVAPVQANPANANAMMDAVGKLHPLQSKKFAGAKADEVKALRTEFKNAVQAAKSQARTEFARLSAGKTPEQFDKAMRDAASKSGTPADVRAAVDAMGGPHRALQQADRILDDFANEVLATSQQFGHGRSAERMWLGLLGVGDAQAGWFKRGACSLAMYVVTVGTSPDSTYKLCDRYS